MPQPAQPRCADDFAGRCAARHRESGEPEFVFAQAATESEQTIAPQWKIQTRCDLRPKEEFV
jgi:hypothetical protein